ncbi:MAG: polyribonucleotide nucleotidyltransferase [Planctomycetota bacterium]|nr:polyribonucleotide nucleotidyltransferase [Planctomycetota bacterium]
MASKKSESSTKSPARKTAATRARKSKASKVSKSSKSSSRRKSSSSDYVVGVPEAVVVERKIGGRTMSIETGRFARQADGAVVVRYGDTMVLATAQSAKAPEHMDFFPLTVDYREKTASAGLIPGGFFKREGRPTTKEVLGCRIIDRSIRPMFPDGYRAEVRVMSQVLSTDRENDPDIIAAVASFAALAISSIPHGKTLGMCRIGLVDDELVVNPLWSVLQSEENKLSLTVAGHDEAIVMVEGGAEEVSEETMLEALELAHETDKQIVELIEELREKVGKDEQEFAAPASGDALSKAIDKKFGDSLRAAPITDGSKHVRAAAIKVAKDEAVAAFPVPDDLDEAEAKAYGKRVKAVVGDIVKEGERESILSGRRADGRVSDSIRPITIDVGVLPRVHGSVLFTRGETQALGIVTLGGIEDQQIIDGLMPVSRKRFLLHYSFPPFSVGECKRLGGPGRREIGHGMLAERGVEPVLPTKEEFPYTMRVTSEILESNGSSSMASACAATLSMMDAGVPIKQPVAGIAMGLVMEGKKYAVLSDILGSEDACGDMDFKVVGTGRGITALQMDIKCDGLTRKIMSEALEQARQGRLHILREMLKSIREPRKALSPNAPRLVSVQVPQDKIGVVIGPAGKNIRAMQEDYECKISIEDGGLCTVTGLNAEKVDAAVEDLKAMTAEVEIGQVYEGRVTAIKEFGAFLEILPGQEGLVHVSELSNDFIRSVTDVVRIGDTVQVKVIAIDDFGKVKLSRKALLPGGGEGGDGDREGRDDRDGEERPRRSRERGRGRGDREDRGERSDRGRGDREDRGERSDRGRRGRGDRDEWQREDRDADGEARESRQEWNDRDDEEGGSRPSRGRRSSRDDDRSERPARGRGGRDGERSGRGRGGRDEDRSERPSRGRGDRDDERSDRDRSDRDSDRSERSGRSRSRSDRDDDRSGRGRGDRDDERSSRGRGDRDDDRSERSSRGRGGRDEDRSSRGRGGWDDGDDQDADRGGRERSERGRGRGGRGRESGSDSSARDGDDREDRGRGRGGRGFRDEVFTEFEPTNEDLESEKRGDDIGDLEAADSLFDDDRTPVESGRGSSRPRRGGGGRRRRN